MPIDEYQTKTCNTNFAFGVSVCGEAQVIPVICIESREASDSETLSLALEDVNDFTDGLDINVINFVCDQARCHTALKSRPFTYCLSGFTRIELHNFVLNGYFNIGGTDYFINKQTQKEIFRQYPSLKKTGMSDLDVDSMVLLIIKFLNREFTISNHNDCLDELLIYFCYILQLSYESSQLGPQHIANIKLFIDFCDKFQILPQYSENLKKVVTLSSKYFILCCQFYMLNFEQTFSTSLKRNNNDFVAFLRNKHGSLMTKLKTQSYRRKKENGPMICFCDMCDGIFFSLSRLQKHLKLCLYAKNVRVSRTYSVNDFLSFNQIYSFHYRNFAAIFVNSKQITTQFTKSMKMTSIERKLPKNVQLRFKTSIGRPI